MFDWAHHIPSRADGPTKTLYIWKDGHVHINMGLLHAWVGMSGSLAWRIDLLDTLGELVLARSGCTVCMRA